jgi:serine/threonine-protein kinase
MRPEHRAHAGREGRYVVGDEIAAGGMATVHLGRMLGDAGFARTVAVKRLHPHFAKDPDFAAMLLDEGRLAARIAHLNVVPTLDVVSTGKDLFVVMEYVHGEALSALLKAVVKRRERIPPRVAAAILAGALRGLHAAHEARDAHGRLLDVVHRDVSPQNILVGADGIARVLDFGIAKAAGRAHVTEVGQIKGKFAYMPPEQLHGEALDRRADVYAAGVVLWESLVGARLFAGTDQTPNLARLLEARVDAPSARVPGLAPAYDEVALRALARAPEGRFPTALAMAEALEACGPVATPAEVGAWVEATAGAALSARAARVAASEQELARRIRDSQDYLDAIEETITDVIDLPLPPLPAAWLEAKAAAEGPAAAPEVPEAPAAPEVPVAPEEEPVAEERRRPAVRWALLGAGGVVLVAATVMLAGGAPEAPAAGSTGSTAPLESAAPVASASVAVPDPPPAASASTSASAEPVASAAPPASARGAQQGAGRPARPPPRDDGCTPPFTIDGAGHKHYKRNCLR